MIDVRTRTDFLCGHGTNPEKCGYKYCGYREALLALHDINETLTRTLCVHQKFMSQDCPECGRGVLQRQVEEFSRV